MLERDAPMVFFVRDDFYVPILPAGAYHYTGFGNGFTGSIASMGLLFMLAFIIGIYFNLTLKRKWGVILSVILLLQGEYFLNYPLVMILPFVDFGSKTVNAKYKFKLIWRKKEIEG